DDAVDAILRWAVRIGQQRLPLGILADLGLPGLGIGEEETLVAGDSVDHLRFAVFGLVALIGAVGRLNAAQVADILAHRQRALDVRSGDRLVGVVLRAQSGGAILERILGSVSPPVLKLAGRTELAALVIEAVTHLMADDRADRAIVHGRIRFGIEEGR